MLDSTEHDHFKCLPVLPGSVYEYNTNRLVGLSLEISIPRSIQRPNYYGQYSAWTIIDLGIGISSLAG